MKLLRDLTRDLQHINKKWTGYITGLFVRVRDKIQVDEPLEELEPRLMQSLRSVYFESFAVTAGAQSKLLGATKVARSVWERGIVQARQYQAMAQERALAVLGKNQIATDSYAALVVGKAHMTAVNQGFVTASIAENATHKMFTRMKTVKQRREHAILEGKIIPIGNNFTVDGYRVPYPHHPDLPLSSVIHCKHAIIGVKLEGRRGKGILTQIEGYFRRA